MILGVLGFAFGLFQMYKKNDALQKVEDLIFKNRIKANNDILQANNNALATEQAKRDALVANTNKEENVNATIQEDLNFLNNNPPKP